MDWVHIVTAVVLALAFVLGIIAEAIYPEDD